MVKNMIELIFIYKPNNMVLTDDKYQSKKKKRKKEKK